MGYFFCFAIEIKPSRRNSLDLITVKSHSKMIRKLSFVSPNRKTRCKTMKGVGEVGEMREYSQLSLMEFIGIYYVYKCWLKFHSEMSV